mgnify:CR=1 FL=1
MILFVADSHYGKNPGSKIHECLQSTYEIRFAEDDWSVFTDENLAHAELLILNMIGDTCGIPHPNTRAEKAVKAYVESGKPLLLLHGSSSAFWQWDWWRKIVGFRWVRGNDPDGQIPSTHPTRPYKVTVSKTNHPLAKQLKDLDLPADEIYINLEQTCPAFTLMETHTDEGTFPQCHESIAPSGSKILTFIPGHDTCVTQHPEVITTIKTLIDYLRA